MPTGPLTKQPSWRQAPADGRPLGVSVVIVTYRNEADIAALPERCQPGRSRHPDGSDRR